MPLSGHSEPHHASSASCGSPGASRQLEPIIRQQLDVMSLQMEILLGRAPHAPAVVDQVAVSSSVPLSPVRPLEARTHGAETQITDPDANQGACLHEWFDARARLHPQSPAAVFEHETLTYGDLQRRSNQVANFLRSQGVQKGTLVGICSDRSPEMLIGILGTLIAGGAYVPLDPNYPRDRLDFILRDARLTRVLTVAKLDEQFPSHRVQSICLDRDWPEIARASAATPPFVNTPQDTAYVVYTSGSTGRPKGVMGLHGATLNRCQWMWNAYPFGTGEVCCQKTSLNFVDSVWEIFGPLLQGFPTVYIPDEKVKEPAELIDVLARHSVSRIVVVPSLLRTLLELEADLQARLPALRYWVSSGEVLSIELARQFKAQLPDRLLLNLYGSSEVAGDVTYYEVEQPESEESIPIGRPISDAYIYLLDDAMQPVPMGDTGEIYVGGVVLAGGYLNRPDLTRERFLDHSVSPEVRTRLYKTGDLGRYRPDGNLDYVGRVDHQVKVRGFRIELGEIEAVLLRHPDVQQAIVMALTEGDRPAQLVAYVQGGSGLSRVELRRYVSQTLPDYMVPGEIVFLDTFPLTPNGKIDRLALDGMRRSLPSDGRGGPHGVMPRTHLEAQLLEIWQSLTQDEDIGVFDHFFEIGGESLLVARMLAIVKEVTGKTVSFNAFIENPTIAGLATALAEPAS